MNPATLTNLLYVLLVVLSAAFLILTYPHGNGGSRGPEPEPTPPFDELDLEYLLLCERERTRAK